TVHRAGTPLRADAVLEERAKRVDRYRIRPLSPDESSRFTAAWRQLQSRFVDDPNGAVDQADVLVTDLMSCRAYPMAEFARRAEDLSVDHGAVVDHYRRAHDVATRRQRAASPPTTEELRLAVMHYRALFENSSTSARRGGKPYDRRSQTHDRRPRRR